mgnify:CR=1 FL=1
MIIIDIPEWIVSILMLGIGLFLTCIAVFIAMVIYRTLSN